MFFFFLFIIAMNNLIATTSNMNNIANKEDLKFNNQQCNHIEYDEFHELHPYMSDRIHQLTTMLYTYQQQHGLNAIMRESNEEFCNRRFMTNLDSWPIKCDNDKNNQGVGNIFGQFLNKIALAVVTNITVVLGIDDILEVGCRKFLKTKKWIPSYAYILDRLNSSDCLSNFNEPHSLNHDTNDLYDRINDTQTLTYFGMHPTEAYCVVNPEYGVKLTLDHRKRSDLLFSSSYKSFNNQRLEGFGFLFRMCFKFPKFNQELVDPLISELYVETSKYQYNSCIRNPNILSIGVHLRHQDQESIDNPSLDYPFDALALQEIDKITNATTLNGSLPLPKCIVYVASDRIASIELIGNYTISIGCESRIAPRVITRKYNPYQREHGMYDQKN